MEGGRDEDQSNYLFLLLSDDFDFDDKILMGGSHHDQMD